MGEETRIDRQHSSTRSFLRVVGPLLLVVGALLLILGVVGMFSPPRRSASPFPGGPDGPFGQIGRIVERHQDEFDSRSHRAFGGFGMAAAGMALMAIGGVMTKFGYMGRVARYAAAELAPVGKDTFNYVATGAREGVKAVASAVSEGIREGAGGAAAQPQTRVRCHKCNAENDAGAKFCSQCGQALVKTKPCPACGELNDGDARFCDDCGHRFD